MKAYSVVLPISNFDGGLARRTLPSWFALNPDEIIVCVDWPVNRDLLHAILDTVAEHYSYSRFSKIMPDQVLPIGGGVKLLAADPRTSPSRDIHMWIRRKGYRAARNDILVGVDIDIRVNRNILEAVRLCGERYWFVSMQKEHAGVLGFYRDTNRKIMRTMAKMRTGAPTPPTFAGLYAFYRPRWEGMEDEAVLNTFDTNTGGRNLIPGTSRRGEDGYLHELMEAHGRALVLPMVGGRDLRCGAESRPQIQARDGALAVLDTGKSPLFALRVSIMYWRPHYLGAYIQRSHQMGRHVVRSMYAGVVKGLVHDAAKMVGVR